MTKPISETLAERKRTHGDFADHARATQCLKEVFYLEQQYRASRGQPTLDRSMRESIDMILHKIGRIVAGNSSEPDHWRDIAGYATLVEQQLEAAKVARPFQPQLDEKQLAKDIAS